MSRISCACHHVMHSAITWLCELCIDVLGSGLAPRGCSDRWRCHPGPLAVGRRKLIKGRRGEAGRLRSRSFPRGSESRCPRRMRITQSSSVRSVVDSTRSVCGD
jgi:hypothetical protein